MYKRQFLPTDPDDIAALAKEMSLDVDELTGIIEGLHEFNPMLGHRAVSYTHLQDLL